MKFYLSILAAAGTALVVSSCSPLNMSSDLPDPSEVRLGNFPDQTLSETERAELVAALEQLQKTLEEKAPNLANNLNPPATDAEIEILRAALGGAKNETLETWFRWHNGAKHPFVELIQLGSVISINDALIYSSGNSVIPDFLNSPRKHSITFLADHSGDGFFFDLSSDPPRIDCDMLEDGDDGSLESGLTLLELVRFMTESFETGAMYEVDELTVEIDYSIYNPLEAKHWRR